jgi:hypothetical protein
MQTRFIHDFISGIFKDFPFHHSTNNDNLQCKDLEPVSVHVMTLKQNTDPEASTNRYLILRLYKNAVSNTDVI